MAFLSLVKKMVEEEAYLPQTKGSSSGCGFLAILGVKNLQIPLLGAKQKNEKPLHDPIVLL